jgi:hypothetical protein
LAAKFRTQDALAVRLNVSSDLVSKIETGWHVPTEDIFLTWLDICEVSEEARALITDMRTLASNARSGFPEFFEKYVTAEEVATFLRLWGLLLVPGPLQTREYAHAIFLKGGLDEDEAAGRTELRLRRSARVSGPDPAHVTALIYEPVLHCLVGTAEVMAGQLEHLLETSQRRNVVIQVVPDTGYFPGRDGEFAIASGSDIPDIVDLITVQDNVTNDPAVVGTVVALFEEIRGYALNVADSRAVISEAIQRWKSQQ